LLTGKGSIQNRPDVRKENHMYQVKLDTSTLASSPLEFEGVSMKVLQQTDKTGGMTILLRMEPGSAIAAHHHTHADETAFVIEGDFIEDGVSYGRGSFLAGRAGTPHGPHGTSKGCVLLITFSAALDFVFVRPTT
jgi:quercetin dioxygenase-like cupin family protein